MDLEEKTPTVEENLIAPPLPESTGAGVIVTSGSSSSCESTSSAESSGSNTTTDSDSECSAGRGREKVNPAPAKSCATASDMSASYHEIFDSQMPPETARAALIRAEEEAERLREDGSGSPPNPLLLSCCDPNTEATTQYLTSKLVRDSLRWQRENAAPDGGGGPSEQACASPRRCTRLPKSDRQMNDPPRSSATVPTPLDPNYLLDIENDARHLATSVDSLVENLASILHNISALTVDAIEVYRDGVCKTCDEVDGNIKSMYQLMAKVEELNKGMGPAYRMGEQLKEIKRLLDIYEAAAAGTSIAVTSHVAKTTSSPPASSK